MTTDGGAVFAHVGDGVFEVVEGAVLGGGDVVAGHQLLGGVFGAFDLGGGLVGAEGLDAGRGEVVDESSIRGTSGPTNAQSYWLCCMKLMKAAWFDSLIWVVRMPSSSMPGLPEATVTSLTLSPRSSACAMACSRAPEPMTKTFLTH